MATPVLVSVHEYLSLSFRPDCDFVDGEIRERRTGEKSHGLLQGILFSIFQANRRAWNLLPILEQRVQTSAEHYRVPDLCLIHSDDAAQQIVSSAPVLCVEVLSREDSLSGMQERVDDYQAMGVAAVWVIDPLLRTAYKASSKGFERVASMLEVAGTDVRVGLFEMFAELDDLLAGRL